MRDTIIEEILQGTLKEHLRHPTRKDPIVPTASRYPHSAKRAELELGRQPWSRQPKAEPETSAPPPFYF